MKKSIHIKMNGEGLNFHELSQLIFSTNYQAEVDLPAIEKINTNHKKLLEAIERKETIYGVTTGFGDSSRRIITPENSETLQKNLITYLTCGVGPLLPKAVCRAVTLFRLHSLSQGLSAVSFELLERMKWLVEEDIVPQILSQGSLGASGDLVPLAYLAQVIQGKGKVWHQGETKDMKTLLSEFGKEEYQLKAKEGLALVNGTTVMAAYSFYCNKIINSILDLTAQTTALCVMAIDGRKEAFNPLINSKAKQFKGQSTIADRIFTLLNSENYKSENLNKVFKNEERNHTVQDKYSIRCAPQILGPIYDTLKLSEKWTELEACGVSDNPIIDEGDEFSMGGNFYGGYISHSMDYLKISMAHLADMIDRQFMCLIDESTNRGLPPNLADWNNIPEEERFLNHGLKGLNQAMSAITSEVMAQANPGGIHSRSSESHNQDKVSLGLSACIQMDQMFENLFTLLAIHLIGCMQALDLRNHKVKSPELYELYHSIRQLSPKVTYDRALDHEINLVKNFLKKTSGAFDEITL